MFEHQTTPSPAGSGDLARRTLAAHNPRVDVLATNYLVPDPVWVVLLVLYAGLFIVMPMVGAIRRGQYVWALAILVFPPFGAILWWTIGRPTSRRLATG